jgi:hypothetical protein
MTALPCPIICDEDGSQLSRIFEMTSLSGQPAQWLPAFSLSKHMAFLASCPVDAQVLFIAVAISICLSLGVLIEHQHQNLDERAMLSAVLAAGGMPLVYSPSALCRAPLHQPARFDHSDIRTLLGTSTAVETCFRCVQER